MNNINKLKAVFYFKELLHSNKINILITKKNKKD